MVSKWWLVLFVGFLLLQAGLQAYSSYEASIAREEDRVYREKAIRFFDSRYRQETGKPP